MRACSFFKDQFEERLGVLVEEKLYKEIERKRIRDKFFRSLSEFYDQLSVLCHEELSKKECNYRRLQGTDFEWLGYRMMQEEWQLAS